MKSEDPIRDYSNVECTTHFWATDIPSKTFSSFEEAIGYVKQHLSASHTSDIHVHNGETPEPTYKGVELSPFLKHG